LGNNRRKRKDSTYFSGGEEKPKRNPLVKRQVYKDLIDYCELCGKEVHWEEAETFGPSRALYHPECLTAYRRQIESSRRGLLGE